MQRESPRSEGTILIDWSVEFHQLCLEFCESGQVAKCVSVTCEGPIDYRPSGLSQILAASGLSGEALLGSGVNFSVISNLPS